MDRMEQEPEYNYFGFVKRITMNEAMKDQGKVAVEDLNNLLRVRILDGEVHQPVPGRPVERFDVWDLESGDLLAFYRVAMESLGESLSGEN